MPWIRTVWYIALGSKLEILRIDATARQKLAIVDGGGERGGAATQVKRPSHAGGHWHTPRQTVLLAVIPWLGLFCYLWQSSLS